MYGCWSESFSFRACCAANLPCWNGESNPSPSQTSLRSRSHGHFITNPTNTPTLLNVFDHSNLHGHIYQTHEDEGIHCVPAPNPGLMNQADAGDWSTKNPLGTKNMTISTKNQLHKSHQKLGTLHILRLPFEPCIYNVHTCHGWKFCLFFFRVCCHLASCQARSWGGPALFPTGLAPRIRTSQQRTREGRNHTKAPYMKPTPNGLSVLMFVYSRPKRERNPNSSAWSPAQWDKGDNGNGGQGLRGRMEGIFVVC